MIVVLLNAESQSELCAVSGYAVFQCRYQWHIYYDVAIFEIFVILIKGFSCA
jgi:hypothetical protein